MSSLTDALDATAEKTRFSGVVRVIGGDEEISLAYGLANRSTGTPVTVDTRFATASGSKTMTALTIASLVEAGQLSFDTRARDLLGTDLPLIDDAVTIGQLLSHTSGIGDYLDEDADDYDTEAYILARPVQEYLTTDAFLPELDGHPQVFAPGEKFAYCNGGFMVLALLAERASGEGFHDLVRTRVLEPAGMTDSGYFRSDRLPPRTAVGYLNEDDDAVSNVFHLPILGNGDGGMYTTADDSHRLFTALLAGRLVSSETVEQMITIQADIPDYDGGYGFGFWIRDEGDGQLHPTMLGEDAGASYVARHYRRTGITRVVLANTTEGTYPMWDTLLEA